MDLRNLTTFIQVAELSSFTRAGEKLGYSQPTVSFQIKQLEQELGVRLFDRIGHTVRLTDRGHDLLAHAQRICHLYQEMFRGTDPLTEPRGVIRLAMADSLCAPLLNRGFARFRRQHPNIAVHMITAGTGELFRLLDHNEVDLVCTLDSPIYDTSYVIANEERIGVHFVVAADHPLAAAEALTPEQLLELPFLLTEKGMSYRRLLDEYLARRGLEVHPVLEIGSADLICRLVEWGIGVSFLPDYVTADALRRGTLVRLSVPDFTPELWKQLLYHREKWISLQMEAVIRYLSSLTLAEPSSRD